MRITFAINIPDRIVRALIPLVLLWRKTRYGYEFRRIKIADKIYTIVEPADYDHLSKYKWLPDIQSNLNYPITSIPANNRKRRRLINMHSMILTVPKDRVVDHINGNPLDNRRSNLRIATYAQNARNVRKRTRKCSSKYKGVSFHKRIGKFEGYIKHDGRRYYLGCFDLEKEAAKAYDAAAKKLHGEFARLNFAEVEDQNILTVWQTAAEIINCGSRGLQGIIKHKCLTVIKAIRDLLKVTLLLSVEAHSKLRAVVFGSQTGSCNIQRVLLATNRRYRVPGYGICVVTSKSAFTCQLPMSQAKRRPRPPPAKHCVNS